MSVAATTWPSFFVRPLSQPGPKRRLVERLMQMGLATGWALPSLVPARWREAAGVVEAVLNIDRTTHKHFVEDREGRATPLYLDAEKTQPAMSRDQPGDYPHPTDNIVDRIQAAAKAYLKVVVACAAAGQPREATLNQRIVSPDGLALHRWVGKLPAKVGIIVHRVLEALATRTREIPGAANAMAELAVGIDAVLGSWKDLKGITDFKEWESLRLAGDVSETLLGQPGLKAWTAFWKKLSENVPASTSLYRLRRMSGLSPIDRVATIASAAMICVSAFESKPRELYWLRAAGEALRAMTVERRTALTITKPLGELRGLIRLAQALHPLIIPHVKNPALKKLVMALLVTDLRIYLRQDAPGRPITLLHEAFRDVEEGNVPPYLQALWATLTAEDKAALKSGKTPEHLDTLWRTSDQPIHDGLVGEANALAKVAVKYPDAWAMLLRMCTKLLDAAGVGETLKFVGLDLWCTTLKALAGLKEPFGSEFPGYAPFDVDRLEIDVDRFETDGPIVKDVLGKTLTAAARPQPIAAYWFWAVVDRLLTRHLGIIKDHKPLPPEHRLPTDAEKPTALHSMAYAAKHPIISVNVMLRDPRPENIWRFAWNMLGAVLPEDARHICNTIGDVPYQLQVARPGLT